MVRKASGLHFDGGMGGADRIALVAIELQILSLTHWKICRRERIGENRL
jgi:hypothetical protein